MKKGIVYVTIFTIFVLMIPLLANAPWTLGDFLVAGVLLFSTGTIVTFAAGKLQKRKIFTIVTILILFVFIWAELAVGIFTDLGS